MVKKLKAENNKTNSNKETKNQKLSRDKNRTSELNILGNNQILEYETNLENTKRKRRKHFPLKEQIFCKNGRTMKVTHVYKKTQIEDNQIP